MASSKSSAGRGRGMKRRRLIRAVLVLSVVSISISVLLFANLSRVMRDVPVASRAAMTTTATTTMTRGVPLDMDEITFSLRPSRDHPWIERISSKWPRVFVIHNLLNELECR